MIKVVAAKLAGTAGVVVGALVLVFTIMHVLPGDLADSLVDVTRTPPAEVAQLRHQLGLDRPFLVQLADYLGTMLRGDFGSSLATGQPVLAMIVHSFPATLALTLSSSFIAVTCGIALGVASAVNRNGFVDVLARTVALFGISMPSFWVGILLIIVFADRLRWFPSMGSSGVRALVLPSLALGLGSMGVIVRLVRNSMLDTLVEPYVATLRAKGLSERLVTYRHALRNALMPAVTMIGLMSAELLGGSVVIETVFARQGLGRLIADALRARDIPVVQGGVFFAAIVYTLLNTLVDLSYSVVDPRIRRSVPASSRSHA